jgi:hypothetical protein
MEITAVYDCIVRDSFENPKGTELKEVLVLFWQKLS